ncbi:MAG: cell envelope integrity protein TolA [Pseudomonadota bacterium]|mgnify:CR=1 FL=1
MHAYVYPSRQEKAISGAFAFGMHLVFLALLVFGVTWQKRIEPQANIVDLWANLPSPAPPKVEPPPELKLEVKPPEPPPAKPVAKPEIAKPDIALKEKALKEKAEKERRALEAKKEADKKRAADMKAAQKLQQEKEAAAKAAQEQQKALQDLAQQQASAQARLRSEYIERIRSRIKGFILLPPNLQGNPEVEIDVIQIPGGEVLSVKLRRSSGVSAYDSAVERAILKASPLPSPPKPELFERELNLKFRPQQ